MTAQLPQWLAQNSAGLTLAQPFEMQAYAFLPGQKRAEKLNNSQCIVVPATPTTTPTKTSTTTLTSAAEVGNVS
ncbi:hypothetical protein [Endozoicomonas sp. SCSIO W0465]|uniref:hypothetical protein n=1 Tax=Endozoicomonas sp. SCSIO W0465 TaxID=2918516 RepID=UPI002075E4DB|nr:hypothetical protein [Endozoicomonas sp. SCSIO W0465]USE38956.1 hypothetical protein MJO57_12780 [Endozoicomonas sp. SCSIO W0465]USE39189.1 hypothetical protein MJO57_14150 [Endozoicomonas sp. SCSIO W0465]